MTAELYTHRIRPSDTWEHTFNALSVPDDRNYHVYAACPDGNTNIYTDLYVGSKTADLHERFNKSLRQWLTKDETEKYYPDLSWKISV